MKIKTFINLNPIFAQKSVEKKKKEFIFDDLHLNGTAYKLWAKRLKIFLIFI